MGLPGELGLLKLEQPWHAGERLLQGKQGTVHTSDEMGPRIYHKVIPESYRDMVGPQPHFMVSFFDPDANACWSSLVFARPGFADCETSDGTHIDVAAALDPRDAAAVAGMMKPGIMVGAVAIDFMTRRRNRFNGVISHVDQNGHFSIRITQAFGNCPKYITRRRVQRMGENLEFVTEPVMEASEIGALEQSIITSADNMYFGTGTAEHGADMNIRGGSPGFARVLHSGSTICWPDYTGNGFYMSLGNVQLQKNASLVFVDWDATGHGVQVAGSVHTIERSEVVDTEMLKVLEEEPQALRLVVMSVHGLRSIPRYSPHVYEKVELSPYNPRPQGSGPEYLAVLQWVRQESQEVRTFELQLAPLPKPGSVVLKPGQHVRLALPALQGKEASPPERTWTVTSSPQWFADHARFQISVKLKHGGLASTWLHQLSREEMKSANIHFLGFSGEFGPQLDPSSGELRSQVSMPRHSVFLTAGIGSTPAVAALAALVESAPRPETLTIFSSVREISELAFLQRLAEAGTTLTQLRVSYRAVILLTGSDSANEMKKLEMMLKQNSISSVQVEAGRLSTKLLTDYLPEAMQVSENIEAFLCGPAGFESAARDAWTAAGFPSSAIRSESFAY